MRVRSKKKFEFTGERLDLSRLSASSAKVDSYHRVEVACPFEKQRYHDEFSPKIV